jgi:hypothetical protein
VLKWWHCLCNMQQPNLIHYAFNPRSQDDKIMTPITSTQKICKQHKLEQIYTQLIQFLHNKSAYNKLQTKSFKNSYNRMHKCTPWSTSFICNVGLNPWNIFTSWNWNYCNLQQAWRQW